MQIRRDLWLKLCGHPRSSPEKKLVPQDRNAKQKTASRVWGFAPRITMRQNDGRIKGLQILDEPAYLGETYRRQAPC